jgi:type IV pilus assembly protein PilM
MSAARSHTIRWMASPPPSAAIEIGARRVTAVLLGAGARPTVAAHATERLADGLVVPSLTTPNLTDRGAVAAAVKRAVEALGARVRRVALVLPDGAAKVSLVRFEKPPERVADLDSLVRWQVKKSVPFPLEQAQISWTRGAPEASGAVELVVAVARRDIVADYEAVCAAAGLQPGLVDLATFNIANAVLAGDAAGERATPGETAREGAPRDRAGDWLLVHVAPDSTSIAVLRGADLVLFRNRPADGEGNLADFVHQTAMYYEDRLSGRGLARVFVAPRDLNPAAAEEVASLCRAYEARGGAGVAEVDIRAAATLADRIAPSAELLRALAAPVGALLRERAS